MLLHVGILKCVDYYLTAVIRLHVRGSCLTVKLHQSCWRTLSGTLCWQFDLNSECDTESHDVAVASRECLDIVCLWNVEWADTSDFGVSTFWNCEGGEYIYTWPNYLSINAEVAQCNVVFILSGAVLKVNFMMCETVCIKTYFVWCVLLYSCEPSTNIVICRVICYEYYCMRLYCTLVPIWSH